MAESSSSRGQSGSRAASEFDPNQLMRSVIAAPLYQQMAAQPRARGRRRGQTDAGLDSFGAEAAPAPVTPVIIDLNHRFVAGRDAAHARVVTLIEDILAIGPTDQVAARPLDHHPIAQSGESLADFKNRYSRQYVFATLTAATITELVKRDRETPIPGRDATQPANPDTDRAIHRIWPDFAVSARTVRSTVTVKVDALRRAFAATGQGIVWAVLDSGIDGDHPHFKRHQNLDLAGLGANIRHLDFTKPAATPEAGEKQALVDDFGHGSHVAGIIAGEYWAAESAPVGASFPPAAATQFRQESALAVTRVDKLEGGIAGMAPRCKLLSLKVLDEKGVGQVSNIIAALGYLQDLNLHGRNLAIHGANISAGYEFDPEWYACGHSPLCVEVNRLVRAGVVVVVAAGNTGYTWENPAAAKSGPIKVGRDLTINDPGNADLAITVGSTHRDAPHLYGVSYFSSKGPTGDGRLKPDVLAPGERIISCAAGAEKAKRRGRGAEAPEFQYLDMSGTSQAAPHVAGIIAAFLSVRREFIGEPEAVKSIVLDTATDLKRERTMQGHGLVDAMRAIQSV